jgi:predicted acetyltransferase
MWDGDFCGRIGFRWQPPTADLPDYCLGHIGYSVVPWKQKQGYGTAALGQLLKTIKPFGLPYVFITTTPDNLPSQKVIERNGGVLVETFHPPEEYYGTRTKLRYRIDL